MKRKEITFYHGDTIWQEYPEHLNWYVPDFCKNLNKLLLTANIKIEDSEVDYDNKEIRLALSGIENKNVLKFDLKLLDKFELLNESILTKLNKSIKSRVKDHILIGYRPSNNSNLTISLASLEDIENIKGSYKPINNIEDIVLKNQTESLLDKIKTIEDLDVEYKSDKYPGDYYLPLFNPNSETEVLQLFNKILILNPNNKIVVHNIDMISTEEVKIVFIFNENKYVSHFGVRDYDKIGLELNRIKKTDNGKYILLEPNEDDLQYSFVDKEKYDLLKKYDFVNNQYKYQDKSAGGFFNKLFKR